MHDNEHTSHHHEESFIRKYIFSLDHKTIGKQFLIYGLIMFFLGGGLALLFRWQLAYPERTTAHHRRLATVYGRR